VPQKLKLGREAKSVIDGAVLRADEGLDDGANRVAIDAVYAARNDGNTMHDAGHAAAQAVLSLLGRHLDEVLVEGWDGNGMMIVELTGDAALNRLASTKRAGRVIA
jgi:hypothetical protein